MKPGHIRIKNKVYFEYYELEKPKEINYFLLIGTKKLEIELKKLKEYEASKQLIEVDNFWREFSNEIRMIINTIPEDIRDDMPCKAEIIGDKATIVELIK